MKNIIIQSAGFCNAGDNILLETKEEFLSLFPDESELWDNMRGDIDFVGMTKDFAGDPIQLYSTEEYTIVN